MRSLASRVLGAARVDREVFREVADDARTLPEAALLIALGGVAQQLGTPHLLGVTDATDALGGTVGLPATIGASIATALLGWLVPAALVWLVAEGARARRESLGRLLRAVGFSAAPQLLYLVALPLGAWLGEGAAWTAAIAVWVLVQAALFVAVQEALEATGMRAAVVLTVAGVLTVALALAAALVVPFALWSALL